MNQSLDYPLGELRAAYHNTMAQIERLQLEPVSSGHEILRDMALSEKKGRASSLKAGIKILENWREVNAAPSYEAVALRKKKRLP